MWHWHQLIKVLSLSTLDFGLHQYCTSSKFVMLALGRFFFAFTIICRLLSSAAAVDLKPFPTMASMRAPHNGGSLAPPPPKYPEFPLSVKTPILFSELLLRCLPPHSILFPNM